MKFEIVLATNDDGTPFVPIVEGISYGSYYIHVYDGQNQSIGLLRGDLTINHSAFKGNTCGWYASREEAKEIIRVYQLLHKED